MLVLQRKRSEEIVIVTSDGLVTIMLVDSSLDRARIGITAPKHVIVHRKEIYDQTQREKDDGESTD